MKLRRDNLDGSEVKNNDTYIVVDNTSLNNLVVSKTILHSSMSTSGHKHEGQEEVYHFIHGTGSMEIDGTFFEVATGDTVLIQDGVFHRVHNTSKIEDIVFICVFDGSRSH